MNSRHLRWILAAAVVLVVGASALVFHVVSSTAGHPGSSPSSASQQA